MTGRRLQPTQRFVGVQATVAANVLDDGPALAECARHPDPPMALGRVFLGAEQRHGVRLRILKHALQTTLKLRRIGQSLVRRKPLLKDRDSAKLSSTELLPQIEVPEPGFRYGRSQILAIKLMSEPRVWLRANVHEQGHAVLAQQRDQ